jgi:hypothetical protein
MRARIVQLFSAFSLGAVVPLLAAQSVANSTSAPALDICSVVANPAEYDGKQIVVESLYRTSIHGAVLMGKGCSDTIVSAKETEDYKADKQATKVLRRILKKDRSEPVEVVVRGTFHVARQGQCFGGDICSGYQVEIAELLSAQVVSQTNGVPDGGWPTHGFSSTKRILRALFIASLFSAMSGSAEGFFCTV